MRDWLKPETRSTGTMAEPLRPFRARPPGETEEQRVEAMRKRMRQDRVYRFGMETM